MERRNQQLEGRRESDREVDNRRHRDEDNRGDNRRHRDENNRVDNRRHRDEDYQIDDRRHRDEYNRGRENAREKEPINTPRHSTYREVSSSGRRSSARKYGNDDDEDDYMRGQKEEGNRSPSKPVRIVGERI